MGWIKKLFIFILGLIAVLAISLFAFKYFRASKADNIRIPKDVYSVIKIDVDGLATDIFKNSISNYSEYYTTKKDSTDTLKRTKIWNIGLDIPAKLYLFSLSDTSSIFYAVIGVNNKDKVQKFLTNDLELIADSSAIESGNTGLYSKRHLKVLLGENSMILSVGPKANLDEMTSLLKSDQKDWQLANSFGNGIAQINNARISYVDNKKNWAKLDFMNGKFALDGYYKSALFKFPSNPKGLNHSDDNVLSLAFNSDLSLILKDKEQELAKLKLPIDSVYKYVGNFASIQLKDNQVMESDTVITYDYDDNFEMIEKKEIQQIEVPDLTFKVMASPHLLGYLPEKMFYKFSKNYSDGMIYLTTNNTSIETFNLIPSQNVLSLVYSKNSSAAKYLGWLPNYDRVVLGTIYGKAISDNEMGLKGEFVLENPDLNSFYQMLVK